MTSQSYKSNNRIWIHHSVLELMKGVPRGSRPEDQILGRAREIIKKGTDAGWIGPPFDPSVLAHVIGIKPIPTNHIQAEAQIVPMGGQFVLHFRTDVTNKRLNFTIAHEIAHTLFPDCAEMIHYRNSYRRSFDPEREVEYLCDVAAAEILMPSPFFDSDLGEAGVTLTVLRQLSDRYLASREAVIRRMASSDQSHCAVVYLSLGFNKKEEASLRSPLLPFPDMKIPVPKGRFRIRKVLPSKGFSVFLPLNKSIPDDSVLYKLLEGEEYVFAEEQWAIQEFRKRLIEGVRLYEQREDIIALVH